MGKADGFLFGQARQIAGIPLFLQPLHMVNAAFDGLEVGHRAAQPALVDIPLADAFRFGGDDILGLLFGADEQDFAAALPYVLQCRRLYAGRRRRATRCGNAV